MGEDPEWDLEADVVVLGSGGAAMTAAISAHDFGAKDVVILEDRNGRRHHRHVRRHALDPGQPSPGRGRYRGIRRRRGGLPRCPGSGRARSRYAGRLHGMRAGNDPLSGRQDAGALPCLRRFSRLSALYARRETRWRALAGQRCLFLRKTWQMGNAGQSHENGLSRPRQPHGGDQRNAG